MTKDIGNSTLIDVWAASGTATEPSEAKKDSGWGAGEKPPFQTMNFIQNEFGEKLNYVLRSGIPAWDAATPYIAGDVVTSGGFIYLATADNTNDEPDSANWDQVTVAGGLGTIASQNANAVAITGGTISGVSTIGTTGDVTIGGDLTVNDRDITIDGSASRLTMKQNDAPTDQGDWQFSNATTSTGQLDLYALNDDGSLGDQIWSITRSGSSRDNFLINSNVEIEADTNSTTDFPLNIPNAAGSYGMSIGAYRMSNKQIGASNIQYIIEAGDHLYLSSGDDIFLTDSDTSPTWSHVASNGDFILRSNTGGDMLQVVDCGATADNNANPYMEFSWATAIGGSLNRMGYIGYAGGANEHFYIWNENASGDVQIEVQAGNKINLSSDIVETGADLYVRSNGYGSLWLIDDSASNANNKTAQFRMDEGLLRGSFRNSDEASFTNWLTVESTNYDAITDVTLIADDIELDGDVNITGGLTVSAFQIPTAKYQHVESNNVTTGAFTSGAWTTRELNTEVYDDIGITLSGNELTLPAGDYELTGTALHGVTNFGTSVVRLRLYNVTDAAVIDESYSMTQNNPTANHQNWEVDLRGVRFSLASSKVIRVEYYSNGTTDTKASNLGVDEIYADFLIRKLG